MIWITAYLVVGVPIKYLSMSDRKMLTVMTFVSRAFSFLLKWFSVCDWHLSKSFLLAKYIIYPAELFEKSVMCLFNLVNYSCRFYLLTYNEKGRKENSCFVTQTVTKVFNGKILALLRGWDVNEVMAKRHFSVTETLSSLGNPGSLWRWIIGSTS